MNEVFKPVNSVDGLVINHDGTVIYYKDKLKPIRYLKKDSKAYKIIYVKDKHYFVSRLVFSAFIGVLPKSRKISYLDGNQLNTHYLNLLPKRPKLAALSSMRKVRGFDDLFINNNGTIIVQYGYEVSIHILTIKDIKRPAACVNTSTGVKWCYVSRLMAAAWFDWPGKGKVSFKDKNPLNNHYKNLLPFSLKEYNKYAAKEFYKHDARKNKHIAIPIEDTKKVKRRLLRGDNLKDIAKAYNCSDMAIVRFKKRHFDRVTIDKINKSKSINTNYISKADQFKIIQDLKQGDKKQTEIAKNYNVSPHVVCRINKQFIKNAP